MTLSTKRTTSNIPLETDYLKMLKRLDRPKTLFLPFTYDMKPQKAKKQQQKNHRIRLLLLYTIAKFIHLAEMIACKQHIYFRKQLKLFD